LRATFRAALRFSPESGGQDGAANGRPLFQGESRVGLAGSFGSVVIGRGLTAFQGPVNNSDPWGTIQQASVATIVPAYVTDPGGNLNGGGAGRTDAVTYNSPNISGFTAAVSLAPRTSASSGAAVAQAKSFSSAWVGFSNGPLTVGGGFENNRAGDKAVAFNGSYNLGVATLAAGYGTTDAAATAGVKGKGYNFGLWVPMGAATVKAGYGVYKAEGTGATATKKLGLGVDYSLSKRTMVYASYGSNSAAAAGAKTGYDFGVRHNF
jgi:predicted porin